VSYLEFNTISDFCYSLNLVLMTVLISVGLLFNQSYGVSAAQRTFFDVVLMLLIVLSLLFAAYRNIHDRMTGETTVTVSPHLVSILSEDERNAVFAAYYSSLNAKGELIEVDYRFMADDLGAAFWPIKESMWSNGDDVKAMEMTTNGDTASPGGGGFQTTAVEIDENNATLSFQSGAGLTMSQVRYTSNGIDTASDPYSSSGGFPPRASGGYAVPSFKGYPEPESPQGDQFGAIGEEGESGLPSGGYGYAPSGNMSAANRSGPYVSQQGPQSPSVAGINLNFSLKKPGYNSPKPNRNSSGMDF
jgi:hypothetical protein